MRALIAICAASCAMWLPMASAGDIPITGRFTGATGYIEGEFHGNDLAGPFVVECPTCAPQIPFPGYGSYLGTVKGEMHLPK